MLKQIADINIAHISYNGSNGAINDIVGGRIQAGLFAVQSVLPLVKAGRLRMIATVGDKRSPWTPDVPTFREAGIDGLDIDAWLGAFAPCNTLPAIASRLTREFVAALSTPEMKEALFQKGIIASPGGAEEMDALLKSDLARWQKVVAQARIVTD